MEQKISQEVVGLIQQGMEPQAFTELLDSRIKAIAGAAWGNGGGFNRVYWRPFDGEKNYGGIGPINRYWLDHDALRLRSWQLMLESEIVQIGVQRYVMWLIGGGLMLKCEPDAYILKKHGINIDPQAFSKEVEAYWNLYANNEISDKAGMETLHAKMFEAEINAIAGGDCLFIININEQGLPVVKLVDGAHVRTPSLATISTTGFDMVNPENGNRIRHGIEMDANNQHVAFWVRKASYTQDSLDDMLSFERIEARDKVTGYIKAYLYYGLRYRLEDVRGLPLIAVCMETTKQLETYKEATVSGAVERAKIALVVQHELGAVGTNPLDNIVLNAMGGAFADIPADSNGQTFQNQVAGTTDKQAINAPPGAKIVALEGKQEVHFSEFFDTNMKVIFAALGIPMEIALMLFGSNYSASRASIKDWEHTLIVKRIKNVSPGYKHIYNIFLVTQVLSGEINAPGLVEAIITKKRWSTVLAYQKARWIGDNPPNIDELKEVNAARLKMGAGSGHLPLDSPENIVLDLGIRSDYKHTLEEYQDTMQYADQLGIEKVELARQNIEEFGNPNEDTPGKKDAKPGKKDAKPTKKNKDLPPGEEDTTTKPAKKAKKK